MPSLDFEAEKRKARDPGFQPIELGDARFSMEMPVMTELVQSRNVLGRIAGTTHADEVILFGAHWDAFGIGTPDPEGRTIRRGANDDGLGIAGVLELARAFGRAWPLRIGNLCGPPAVRAGEDGRQPDHRHLADGRTFQGRGADRSGAK